MAVASRNGVDVVANEVSGRQTPSAVYFAGNHRLIGEHTTGHTGGDPSNLVHRLKSLLGGEGGQGVEGEEYGQVDGDNGGSGGSSSTTEAAEPTFFCETRRGDEGVSSGQSAGLRAVVRHMGQKLELGASEVISYLLRHCAGVVTREVAGRDGEAASLSASPSSCVVASVPSYFSLRQKRAVLDAASIAGVPMSMVIDEGTAVALAYGILKGGLPAAGSSARPPLKVAFVDIGHSCTQVERREGGVSLHVCHGSKVSGGTYLSCLQTGVCCGRYIPARTFVIERWFFEVLIKCKTHCRACWYAVDLLTPPSSFLCPAYTRMRRKSSR